MPPSRTAIQQSRPMDVSKTRVIFIHYPVWDHLMRADKHWFHYCLITGALSIKAEKPFAKHRSGFHVSAMLCFQSFGKRYQANRSIQARAPSAPVSSGTSDNAQISHHQLEKDRKNICSLMICPSSSAMYMCYKLASGVSGGNDPATIWCLFFFFLPVFASAIWRATIYRQEFIRKIDRIISGRPPIR